MSLMLCALDAYGSSARFFRFCCLRLAQVHVSFVLSLHLRWSRARAQKASMATSLVRAPGEGAGSSDRWPHAYGRGLSLSLTPDSVAKATACTILHVLTDRPKHSGGEAFQRDARCLTHVVVEPPDQHG